MSIFKNQTVSRGFHVFVMAITVIYTSGISMFVPIQAAQATSGAIWTTTGSCGEPQNVNEYAVGDHVFINASGFDPEDAPFSWDINTVPPSSPVASGSHGVLEDGTTCFDAYTIQPGDDGVYKVTFGGKHDNYHVDGNTGGEEEVPTSTIIAHKIVCTEAADLPNWGQGGPDITETTASDWVASHESCSFVAGWLFQYADGTATNPGNNTGEAGDPWVTFGPTDGSGMATTVVPVYQQGGTWYREVMQDGYLPFSGINDETPTAQMYCNNDVLNNDNYDRIYNTADQTYYCVAWNMAERKEPPMYEFGGYKWNDLNGDGQWSDEPTLAGWTITLWQGESQIDSTQTDENGWYHFSVIAGTYTVCEEQQNGWTQTYPVDPNCHTVTVPNENQEVSYNFGNHKNGVVLSVTKIVCTDEADLPNWGDHKTDGQLNPPMIDAATAANWIATHESCSLQPGWSFQWAPAGTEKPTIWNSPAGDNSGELGAPWTTFGVTDGSGKVTTEVPTGDYTHIWVREVMQDGYIHFTNNATKQEDGSDVSAEIYCGWDIWNYDNYDYADMQTAGVTRYCVAWNSPVKPPVSHVIASKVVCDQEAYLPNWGDNDPANPDITATTAQDWVDASNGHCSLARGWKFQWAPAGTANPGNDLYGEAGAPWTTFDSGVSTEIPVTNPGVLTWFREVNQEGYIPFTGDNTDDYTAQFYCNNDVMNNDNYDGIYNTTPDQTFYCVGWNTSVQQPTGSIHGQKFNDLNGNGTRDCVLTDDFSAIAQSFSDVACEPYLNGWTIFIDENGNGSLDDGEQSMVTQTEGQDGWYWFTDLQPGTYSVCEVPQDGWTQTYPINENYNCHTITVPQGQEGDTCFNPLTLETEIVQNEVLGPTCNFGNQEKEYTIAVYKTVVPINGDKYSPEGWTWSLDAEDGIANGDSRTVSSDVDHTITETPDQFTADAYDATYKCVVGEGDILSQGSGRSFSTDDFTSAPWNGAHVSCEFTNTEKPAFDLTLTKEVDKTVAEPGDNLTYTLTWGVTGNTNVDIDLKDSIPTHTSFVSATDGGTLDGNEVKWDLGVTTPPDGGSVSFTVQIDEETTNGTQITNVATITGSEVGPETEVSFVDSVRSLFVSTANAADPLTKTVESNLVVTTVLVGQVQGDETTPHLEINKKVDVAFANAGDKPQYTITVKNTGDGAALNVVVTDTLPDGLTFGDGDTTKTWNLGDILPGGSKDIMYTALISSTATAGNYVNVAEATADNNDPVQDSATVDVRVPAVLGALADAGIAARDIYLLLNGLLLILLGAWVARRAKASNLA